MRTTTVEMPIVAAVAATRVMLGAGVALLLGDRLDRERKKALGWILLGGGALTTFPLAWRVIRGCRETEKKTF